MQSDHTVQKLIQSPAFQVLLRKKTRMVFFLSGLMLVVFSLFFFSLAYLPEWMGSTLIQGSVISIGIWFSVACVIFSVLISGFYIWWANNFYDSAIESLLQESSMIEE